MGCTVLYDPERLRAAYEAMPGRSRRARCRAVAAKVGCSMPTVVRAVNRADLRRDGGGTAQGPGHDAYRQPGTLARAHPAVAEGRTLYPSMVRDVHDGERVLKSGVHSAKIGGVIVKGRWKGFPVYTLTLEERASCPPTCQLYASCYGNGTPFARRFRHGEALERRLALEVPAAQLAHPGGFVVRLHNLGDFYSWPYVDLWRDLLADHPGLRVFGYTAHVDPDRDAIARRLGVLARDQWGRFAVRFSNGWALRCTTVTVEHAGAVPPDAILCPQQAGKALSCAECALCWETDRRIAFLRH